IEDVLGKVTGQARGLLTKAADEVVETGAEVEAEVVSVTTETAAALEDVAAEIPAKKAPAKKAPAKKVAPAKKATGTTAPKK
ncbi:heparin-binding hemagglutinin, partial [Nocardia gipuzkoensis]